LTPRGCEEKLQRPSPKHKDPRLYFSARSLHSWGHDRLRDISEAMSTSKATVKAIAAAVKAQKYDEVIQQSQKLLATDPQSYQG